MPKDDIAKARTRKRKRLRDIQSFEVALVPRGANQAQFVVMKEDKTMKLDLKRLTEAHNALGRIVTVCKSGTPAAETVETISADLQVITRDLVDMSGSETKLPDVSLLQASVAELGTIADALSGSTYDLNLQDQIDVLVEKLQGLSGQLETLPASSEDEPELDAAPVAQDAEEAEEVVEAAPAQAEEVSEAVADEAEVVAAPADDAGVSADAADEGEVEEVVVEAAKEEPAEDVQEVAAEEAEPAAEAAPQTVTKEDLVELGKTIAESFKEAVATLHTSLKSADTGRPTLLYPAGSYELDNSDTEAQEEEAVGWGSQFDLNADD